MVISLQHVSKKFGPHQGLNPTSLVMQEDLTTVLIGPSGCGKSTLLRLLVGLLKPTSGQIFFDGIEVNDESINQIRRKIGYVIQDGGLFPHLSAKANISLLAKYLKSPPQWIKDRIALLSDLVHLPAKILDSYPQELSGGERQRVSLMRALMLDPQYVFLDEPLAALDPIARYELQLQLKEIFSKLHKTVILVTHDMREAAYLGENIVLMRDGNVVQNGKFASLLHDPVEPFVTNFIQAQHYPLGSV